jgi:anthranilate/para-aminobenzoate synthase component II
MKILVLDNYDSFTYNLVHLIEKVSEMPFDVIRNDKISSNRLPLFPKQVYNRLSIVNSIVFKKFQLMDMYRTALLG